MIVGRDENPSVSVADGKLGSSFRKGPFSFREMEQTQTGRKELRFGAHRGREISHFVFCTRARSLFMAAGRVNHTCCGATSTSVLNRCPHLVPLTLNTEGALSFYHHRSR